MIVGFRVGDFVRIIVGFRVGDFVRMIVGFKLGPRTVDVRVGAEVCLVAVCSPRWTTCPVGVFELIGERERRR